MSREEEPDFQWLEDASRQLCKITAAAVAGCFTILVASLAAIASAVVSLITKTRD